MFRNFFAAFLFSIPLGGLAQLDSQENIIPVSGYLGLTSFTYRLHATEYITNENEYFLAVTDDTSYITFQSMGDSFRFRVQRWGDEKFTKWPKNADTLAKIPLEIEFGKDGRVKKLLNWHIYRDLFMAGFSTQAKAGLITSVEFEEAKRTHNDEGFIRRLVMEDIQYLFSLYGDTFNTGAEYIRLKTVRSPFSGNDYYFKGSLKLQRPTGTKNTVIFETVNKAGPDEKPLLMDEAMAFQRKKLNGAEPASEIHAVGLNSEQNFQYNMAQGRMMIVTFSDVVSLDFSSRGNIRKFELWQVN